MLEVHTPKKMEFHVSPNFARKLIANTRGCFFSVKTVTNEALTCRTANQPLINGNDIVVTVPKQGERKLNTIDLYSLKIKGKEYKVIH